MPQQELNASAYSWVQKFHAAGDRLRPDESVSEFYSADCVMEFPGQPARIGQGDIRGFFEAQFAHLESMKHTIKTVDALPDKIYQEATISYVVKGDPEKKTIDIQGIAIFGKKADEDVMSYFRVYLDPAPLLERIKQVQGQ